MNRFETLPDDVRSKLKTELQHTSGNELLPAEVAETMVDHDRPLWTASQMQAELETGHGKETVRKKLRTLDEVGICNSMEANNGRIYWWDDDRSEWPIPPDVDVERSELTVSELLDPWYAKVALVGLLGPTIAGLPLLVGIFQISGTLSLPLDGTELLSLGLVIIVISYFVLLYGMMLAVTQRATGELVDMEILRRE